MKSSAQIYSAKLPSEVVPVLRANGLFVELIVVDEYGSSYRDMNGENTERPYIALHQYRIHGEATAVEWAIKLLADKT
jgi:hypothetical protein